MSSPAQPLAGVSVLLVDDDDDARELTEIVLRHAGATVRSASSAPAALDLFKAATPAVVGVDLGVVGVRDPFVDVLDPRRHVFLAAAKGEGNLLESDASGGGDARGVIGGEERVLPANRRRRAERYAPCHAIVRLRR